MVLLWPYGVLRPDWWWWGYWCDVATSAVTDSSLVAFAAENLPSPISKSYYFATQRKKFRWQVCNMRDVFFSLICLLCHVMPSVVLVAAPNRSSLESTQKTDNKKENLLLFLHVERPLAAAMAVVVLALLLETGLWLGLKWLLVMLLTSLVVRLLLRSFVVGIDANPLTRSASCFLLIESCAAKSPPVLLVPRAQRLPSKH